MCLHLLSKLHLDRTGCLGGRIRKPPMNSNSGARPPITPCREAVAAWPCAAVWLFGVFFSCLSLLFASDFFVFSSSLALALASTSFFFFAVSSLPSLSFWKEMASQRRSASIFEGELIGHGSRRHVMITRRDNGRDYAGRDKAVPAAVCYRYR